MCTPAFRSDRWLYLSESWRGLWATVKKGPLYVKSTKEPEVCSSNPEWFPRCSASSQDGSRIPTQGLMDAYLVLWVMPVWESWALEAESAHKLSGSRNAPIAHEQPWAGVSSQRPWICDSHYEPVSGPPPKPTAWNHSVAGEGRKKSLT